MNMATEVKANLGTKLTADEEKNFDKSKVLTLSAQPKDAVVGQDFMAVQICPYCGCVGYGDESPNVYRLYTCHCCGRTFRA
jgi:hypothetical protein